MAERLEKEVIEGISARMAFPYKTPNIEYDLTTVKSTVKVKGDTQQTVVYTYDKHGRLMNSAVRSHMIGEV